MNVSFLCRDARRIALRQPAWARAQTLRASSKSECFALQEHLLPKRRRQESNLLNHFTEDCVYASGVGARSSKQLSIQKISRASRKSRCTLLDALPLSYRVSCENSDGIRTRNVQVRGCVCFARQGAGNHKLC